MPTVPIETLFVWNI